MGFLKIVSFNFEFIVKSRNTHNLIFRMDTFTQVKGHGKKISGALFLALEEVNNCSCNFEFVVDKEARHDTQRDEKIALKATMDLMYKNNVAALIGLEGPNCHYSAQAATSMNRLMISYG